MYLSFTLFILFIFRLLWLYIALQECRTNEVSGKHSVLGASGEISDFQEILRSLDELILHDNMWDDGNSLGPKEVHNHLSRLMSTSFSYYFYWFYCIKVSQKMCGALHLRKRF